MSIDTGTWHEAVQCCVVLVVRSEVPVVKRQRRVAQPMGHAVREHAAAITPHANTRVRHTTTHGAAVKWVQGNTAAEG